MVVVDRYQIGLLQIRYYDAKIPPKYKKVGPDYQGQGYASTLLKAMFTRIDNDRLPCFLETQNANNVPIYQHYGFKVVEESIVPNTKVTNWAMLREKVG